MAEQYSVDIDEYEGLTDDGADIEQIASEEAFKAAVRTQRAWRENLDEGKGAIGSHPRSYRTTGEAAGDITVTPTEEGAEEYEVGGDVVQLAVAEFGRVPTPNSPPPFDAIADWARERGLRPEGEQSFEEMVEALRWSIAEEGLEPFGPGRLAAQQEGPEYERRAKERIERAIEEERDG
jgi:hypothetical protein